jgi:hypothetical protein
MAGLAQPPAGSAALRVWLLGRTGVANQHGARVCLHQANAGAVQCRVVDACGEACNVLSGCVVQELDGGTPLELGLPVHLIASEYTELTSNSTLRLSFEAGPVARDVLMYLFDPLSPLATREN